MGHTLGMFAKVKSTTESLQQSISEKLNRAENTGFRLIARNKKQQQHKALLRDRALNEYEEKRMLRSVMMQQRLASFSQDGRDEGTGRLLGQDLSRDLRRMHSSAAGRALAVCMARIMAHEWFPAVVAKLRDFMRRLNADVSALPSCCLRLTIFCKHILQFGHSVSREVLYVVIDGAVVQKEDHMKLIVHQTLRLIRDGIGVSAREFLSYFDERGLEPNPELLNEISIEDGVRSGAASAAKRAPGQFFPRAPSARTVSCDSSSKIRTLARVESRGDEVDAAATAAAAAAAAATTAAVESTVTTAECRSDEAPALSKLSEIVEDVSVQDTDDVVPAAGATAVPKPKGAIFDNDDV